jgi:SAM-dependent methyltransferase
MDWVADFYSRTGHWWGEAEAGMGPRDLARVEVFQTRFGDGPRRLLELGCGYGNTAAAFADAGHEVTAIELTDRADYAAVHVDRRGAERLRVIRGDFYEVAVEGRFDVVAYWNGFGVGSDADQRRLLSRIASEWLGPEGAALIDVFNPLVWAGWDGDVETLRPDPERGYHRELTQRIAFDPVSSTAIDTWTDAADPEREISQRLRCYSPADLRLLLEGTGLVLDAVIVDGEALDLEAEHFGDAASLRNHHEHLAVLRPATGS